MEIALNGSEGDLLWETEDAGDSEGYTEKESSSDSKED